MAFVVVALTGTSCRGADGAQRPTTTVAPAPSTTVVASTVPGAVRTATGAGGAPRDERIGPPANGRPSDGALETGMCFNDVLVELNGEVHHQTPAVDCSAPHDGEVFGVASLEAKPNPASAFPGDREAGRAAGVVCLAAFEPWVGREYATSRLRIAILRPTESTWVKGDRTVVCSIYDQDLRPLVGPMRGAAV